MVWYAVGALFIATFGLAAFVGAPYLPIMKQDYEPLLDLAGVKDGQTLIDLGSGDGRLMRAAAARGARVIGYEINPLLYLVSLAVCWPYRTQVSVRLGDYWHAKLPESDVIYVFLLNRLMGRLDSKLRHELTRDTKVVSFVFEFPGRTPVATSRNAFVYLFPAISRLSGTLKDGSISVI